MTALKGCAASAACCATCVASPAPTEWPNSPILCATAVEGSGSPVRVLLTSLLWK